MTIETIITAIMAAAPSLAAIIGAVLSYVKTIKNNKLNSETIINKFEETRKAVLDTKEYESLKLQLEIAHKENRELKKKINELLTKIDKVVREDVEENEK